MYSRLGLEAGNGLGGMKSGEHRGLGWCKGKKEKELKGNKWKHQIIKSPWHITIKTLSVYITKKMYWKLQKKRHKSHMEDNPSE